MLRASRAERTQWCAGTAPVKFEHLSPSRSRLSFDAKLHRCHASARPERTTRPWRPERPKVSDNRRILWLGHQVLYTYHLSWPGDQPGRPSWPWKCAHVRCRSLLGLTPRLRAHGYIHMYVCMSRVPSVSVVVGHCFMNVWTHPDHQEPLYNAGGAPVT